MSRICRACRGWRGDRHSEGLSSLYAQRDFILCEPCWDEEDILIDRSGTNDHPEIVAAYERRPSGLEIVRGREPIGGLGLIRAAVQKATTPGDGASSRPTGQLRDAPSPPSPKLSGDLDPKTPPGAGLP